MKLAWYYNNALGRPNKKKFIARSKSYFPIFSTIFFLFFDLHCSLLECYVQLITCLLSHCIPTATMVQLWYQLVFQGKSSLKLQFLIPKIIITNESFFLSQLTGKCFVRSLPALHQQFDLPAPFILHTDCPHYWRFHLPGCLFFFCLFPPFLFIFLGG